MLQTIENLKLVSVLQGLSALNRIYTCRPSHAFVFKISGESVYTFSDGTVRLSRGEMLFIPEGETYTVSRTCREASRFVLINFHGETDLCRPMKYRLDDRLDFSHLCARLCKCCVQDTASDRYKTLSLFYEILACVAEGEVPPYRRASTLTSINPAVEYLMDHLFDPGLRVGTLHTFCGLSDTYFRKIFLARFGVSPKKYVLNKRLSQAKAILDSGEYTTIAEAAALAGFDDPLYFSKVFKQCYGVPPTAIQTPRY